MSTWIDFKHLKANLDFRRVLEHYHVELKPKGDQASGFCPLPPGAGDGHDGQRKSPSFSANLKRGIWQCFGCGAKGNVLDFAVRMEGRSPDNPADVRDVALKLQEHFGITSPRPGKPENTAPTKAPSPEQKAPASEKPADRVEINAPLDFELQNLEPTHPYLAGRKLAPETIAHFGLGFCGRGLMAGRIAIPLHDMQGRLIGYAGRLVNDGDVTDDTPKYKFPPKRERNGVSYEFRKSLFVYNGHRNIWPVDDLIVVEGFPSVWWLWQCGFPNTVALMGSTCSAEQAAILFSGVAPPGGRIWVFPDGDDAGRRCACDVFQAVGHERFIRWVSMPERKQPTDCSPEELAKLLGE